LLLVQRKGDRQRIAGCRYLRRGDRVCCLTATREQAGGAATGGKSEGDRALSILYLYTIIWIIMYKLDSGIRRNVFGRGG